MRGSSSGEEYFDFRAYDLVALLTSRYDGLLVPVFLDVLLASRQLSMELDPFY